MKGELYLEQKIAETLSDLIRKWSVSSASAYEIEPMPIVSQMLQGFHQWTNRKRLIDGFQVAKRGEESYYVLFIDWHRNDNFYLVVYMPDKSTTVAEIQRVTTDEATGQHALFWKYNPLKRDGKNDLRKAYFIQTFGSTTVQIPLPTAAQEVESFFNQLFALCRNRLHADRIVNVFDVDRVANREN